MKRTYNVEIMGQKFVIKSDETQEHVNQVIDYVSDKMKKISKMQKVMSVNDISILTLLNVTDELFKQKEEIKTYKDKLMQKSKNILRIIDARD